MTRNYRSTAMTRHAARKGKAATGMGDHDGSLHQRIKAALKPLESALAIGVS